MCKLSSAGDCFAQSAQQTADALLSVIIEQGYVFGHSALKSVTPDEVALTGLFGSCRPK
jgi:hypothetical protein